MLFDFGSNQDFADSSSVIAFADAGGLGLPDRDYYTKTDAKSEETRAEVPGAYDADVWPAGRFAGAAAANAKTVMRIETALAKASLTRVEQRDPYKLFHKMTLAQLQALTPSFQWSDYLAALQAPPFAQVNVSQPAFYRELETQLKTESLDDLKTYLRWHLVHAKARFLSSKFVEADFNFSGKYLRGADCHAAALEALRAAGGSHPGRGAGAGVRRKKFHAGDQGPHPGDDEGDRRRHEERDRKPSLDEPGHETTGAAQTARGVANKIGYPDKWRDYSSVDDPAATIFSANVDRAAAFESRRDLPKIGKPVDRTEWQMSPPTVNAYYDPQMNDINFPAGVLQPPLFDPKMDDAPNYGDTGATIGHELTHGFDDEGRQFDAKGNLHDWWTKSDAAEFQKRADCVSDEYSQFTVVDDIKINGKLTMGEDVADLGGTLLAYIAWKAANKGKMLEPIDGFTPEQRFFIGMAQWACGSERPEQLRDGRDHQSALAAEYRVNGVVSNMPEFQQRVFVQGGAADGAGQGLQGLVRLTVS